MSTRLWSQFLTAFFYCCCFTCSPPYDQSSKALREPIGRKNRPSQTTIARVVTQGRFAFSAFMKPRQKLIIQKLNKDMVTRFTEIMKLEILDYVYPVRFEKQWPITMKIAFWIKPFFKDNYQVLWKRSSVQEKQEKKTSNLIERGFWIVTILLNWSRKICLLYHTAFISATPSQL